MTRIKTERIAVCVLLLATLAVAVMTFAGCSTVTAVRSGTASWQQIATSTCTDLQTAGAAASAAVAWSKIYFPNQDAVFTEAIEPLLTQVAAGIDAYCSAASLVQDVDGIQALFSKQAEILELVQKLNVLVAAVKS